MLTITKVRPAANENRDKKRTTTREKGKKQEPFQKVLAVELTQPPPKRP